MKYKLDTAEAVCVKGETYYLRIRSDDETGPVVLFLHGGPGSADRPFVMKWQSPLAKLCTIVAWDQRGAGLAYDRKRAKTEDLTKEQYIQDTHNVIQYLKERFQKEKIILVGHSFGSQLGVWVCQRYPEDIECYVGVGQVVDPRGEELSFQFTMNEARKRNDDKAVKTLSEIGPPINGIYKDGKVLVQRNYLNKYGGVQYGKYGSAAWNTLHLIPCMFREYSLGTMLRFLEAGMHCLNSPIGPQTQVHFFTEATEFEMPVYLFLGHHDYNTPFELAEEWYNALKAPHKQLVWFERSGHEPQWEEPEAWNRAFARFVLKRPDIL